jgi:hypothetical protein
MDEPLGNQVTVSYCNQAVEHYRAERSLVDETQLRTIVGEPDPNV